MISTRRATSRWAASGAALVAALALTTACSGGSDKGSPAAGDGTPLVGLFKLTAGTSQGGTLSGTYFRMVQPKGTPAAGPYMVNGDSPADGGKATLLSPGTSGGLRTAGYQSQPSPAFDKTGNSLSAAITLPTKFFGVKFSISTNAVDPQTQTKVAPPTIVEKDGKLSADMAAWAASWNNQQFNQGAPKPVSGADAKALGQEQAEKVFDWVSKKYLAGAPKASVTGNGATGTYDAKTGAFTLEWTSLIVGGPFNSFTGLWHLEGTFEASAAAPSGS